MKSGIYEGQVRHRRFAPVAHAFSSNLFMMYLDLAELPALFDRRWLWSTKHPALARFRREDHLGPSDISLDVAVRDLVERETGARPAGPIRLLTHLRYFGYCFNPVSFYFIHHEFDRGVETIVAEVNNTPWGEQYPYVLDKRMNRAGQGKHRYYFDKQFHVSPFMAMNQTYHWYLTDPNDRLSIHMENYEKQRRIFDATMVLERREISTASLAAVLTRYPLMTAKVIGGIYYNALKLRLKGCPIFDHPATIATPVE